MVFDIFNEDWAQTFGTLEDIMWFLLLYLIFLIIMAIFLKIALSFFKSARHIEYGSVFFTAFIITVIYALTFLFLSGWVAWVIVLIVAWLIISARHHTGFFGAIAVTIIAFLLYVIVAMLLGLLLGVTLIILPF
ncbi:MAG: hypothetical protein ACFE8G_08690 [Candidatus Hermodarchaeota archaeon]